MSKNNKPEPMMVPPEAFFFLIFVIISLLLAPLGLIWGIAIIIILLAINANMQMTLYTGGIMVMIGIIIYSHPYEWASEPFLENLLMYQGGYYTSCENWVQLFINTSCGSGFLAHTVDTMIIQIMNYKSWFHFCGVGGLYGALCYAVYLKIKLNPISQVKRQKQVKPLKKVGKIAQAIGHKTDAHTASGNIIGTDRFGKNVILNDNEANEHVLVLGTTGSGKTVTISNIVESAINRGLPVIYIDGKGDYDLAKRIQSYAKQNARPTWIFGMRGDSVRYDPLSSGGYTSKKDRIIGLREWTEEHYKKLAEGYLQCVFKVLEILDIPSDLVSLSKHLDIKKLKALVRDNQNKTPLAGDLMDMLNEQDQAAKSIESLVAEIRNFTNSEIGHLFKPEEGIETLTLEKVLNEKGVAYFSLPSLEFSEAAQTLGRLIINDLKATMGQQLATNNKHTLYAIFDEFSVFAGEQALNVINMGRSAGIHAVLSTQSLSDIAAGRKENADHFINQVVGNCNTFIMHRQNSPDDAETLASVIGTKPSLEYTAQISQKDPTHMGTVRRTRGFLAHPDEIKSLGRGEAFYYSKHTNKLTRIMARLGKIHQK